MSAAAEPPRCSDISSGLGFVVGVLMGVVGSIGINVGQNLQASGITSLSLDGRSRPWRSTQWTIGTSVFILFSLINFAALALAPASILTSLESIQYVSLSLSHTHTQTHTHAHKHTHAHTHAHTHSVCNSLSRLRVSHQLADPTVHAFPRVAL